MVQLSVSNRAPAPVGTLQPADGLTPLTPSHDEQLLVAALERIEFTRSALEELMNGGVYSLVFA
jgi:hypothetical protein